MSHLRQTPLEIASIHEDTNYWLERIVLTKKVCFSEDIGKKKQKNYKCRTRLGLLQRSGVQLSENLASLGIMYAKFKSTHEHHGSMVPRGLRRRAKPPPPGSGCTFPQPGCRAIIFLG